MMETYVAEGKTAGMLTLVSHKGKIIHFASHGYSDIETKAALQTDTIFRIYSMTKPLTSIALMRLMELGHFQLDDAAYGWIPALKKLKVYAENGKLEALEQDITIRQLLTHTAGFSYGYDSASHPVDKMYAETWRTLGQDRSLSEMMAIMFEIPLIAQPGSRWHYSIATDICGYLVELMSGMPFADYLRQTLLDPLDMTDTAFEVSADKLDRFASLYGYSEDNSLAKLEFNNNSPYISTPHKPIKLHSGGSGLVSTTGDYLCFAQMMLNRGEFEGKRIVSPETVDLMTINHVADKLLPLSYNGMVPELLKAYGFGLGYCINLDPDSAGSRGSQGEYGWGGMADSYCLVDPQRDLIGILMQQYMPSLHYAGRRDFRNAVYAALD